MRKRPLREISIMIAAFTVLAGNVFGQWEGLGGSNTGTGISGSTGTAQRPAIATDAQGNPIIAWQDDAGGVSNVYARRWNGEAWVEMGDNSASASGVSGSTTGAYSPSIATDASGNPVVAWQDDDGANNNVYLKRWNGEAWVEVGGSATGKGISDSTTCSYYPAVTVQSDGSPVVAWQGYANNRANIYMRRWNGEAWVEVGDSASGNGVSAQTEGEAAGPCVTCDESGNPVIAWPSKAESGAISVYTRGWNGTLWGDTQTPSGDSTHAVYPSLAGSDKANGFNDNPAVVWADDSSGTQQINLKRWNGEAWVEVGDSASGGGISDMSGTNYATSVTIAPDGQPVISWTNHDTTTSIYVADWDAATSSWSKVDNTYVDQDAYRPSVAVDGDGHAVVAYQKFINDVYQIYVGRSSAPVVDMVTLTVTASPSTGGSTNPSGSQKVVKGSTVALTATANDGYDVTSWACTENGTLQGSSGTTNQVTVNGDTEVTVTFSPTSKSSQVSIASNPTDAGTTSPSGTINVESGKSYDITATPSGDNTFSGWVTDSGYVVFSDSDAATTQFTVYTPEASFSGQFTSNASGGALAMNKFKTTLQAADGKDSISVNAGLPSSFPYSALSSGVSVQVGGYDVPLGTVEDNGKGKHAYSGGKSPAVKVVFDEKKQTMSLNVKKGSLSDEITPGEQVYVNVSTGGEAYTAQVNVDQRTTWKHKGAKGADVTTLSGTCSTPYNSQSSESTFTLRGNGMNNDKPSGFVFTEWTPSLAIDRAEWALPKGSEWDFKGRAYVIKTGGVEDMEVQCLVRDDAWSFKTKNCPDGDGVNKNGPVNVNFTFQNGDQTWTPIDTTLSEGMTQKTTMTLAK